MIQEPGYAERRCALEYPGRESYKLVGPISVWLKSIFPPPVIIRNNPKNIKKIIEAYEDAISPFIATNPDAENLRKCFELITLQDPDLQIEVF